MHTRIISLNANGIRSAARKGFFEWVTAQNADFICLQETKADMDEFKEERFYHIEGYECHFHNALKKGYSGVGIYFRKKADKITTGLGWTHADQEGRYIQADFGNLSVASLYMPSGSSSAERQKIKFEFLDLFQKILDQIKNSNQKIIICGDWNIVHREIDIKNFKSNQKTSGCLPEERAWLDRVLTGNGFIDAFRVVNQDPEQYTWWSNRGQAYAKNVGWRIDYQILSPNLINCVKSVSIYKEQRFSDHVLLIIDYDL